MLRTLAFLALAAELLSAGLAKHISSYDIKARLNPETKLLTGSEVLTWLNDSPDTISSLRFHLYMNAFKNERSTFMKESGGQLRGDFTDKREWGWVDVKKLQLAGGADLTKAIRFIHPDDDNAEDQTVIEVALPEPVKPGQSLQLLIDFETKFPKVFARTGFQGTFFLGGQWFPKIGVWETTGFRHAPEPRWNCHQFHANSEFYSNFGRYHVELTFPSEYIVGATGELKSKTDDTTAKTTTHIYEQEDVTDFAWTAQPTYLREERLFSADRQTTPKEIAEIAKIHGIPESETRLTDVRMILLLQPEHREQMDRHFRALEAAIKWFGLWYGHYPYKTITVVDPPHGGGGAGGMEYPTFITAGTSYKAPPDFLAPEMVTIHEFGHQFWKELIANNEFEESWLDEGFNTYSTGKVLDKTYPPTAGPLTFFGFNFWRPLGLPLISDGMMNRSGYVSDPVTDSIVRNAWSYYNGNSYSINSYMKTGVTLNTLERILGSEVMARAMRTFHQRYRFHHPDSIDFEKTMEVATGRDLHWFFDQFVFGNRLLDYSIGSVRSSEVETPIGIFDTDKGRVTVTDKDAEKKDKDRKGKAFETVVRVRREGDAVVPVEIRVTFENGSVEKREWDGIYRWAKFTFRGPSKAKLVEIDPENKLLLDVNRANNSYTLEPQTQLLGAWGANFLFWAENALLWLTSIA